MIWQRCALFVQLCPLDHVIVPTAFDAKVFISWSNTLDLCSKANYSQLVNNLFVPLYIPLPLYLVRVGLLLPNTYTTLHVPPSLLTCNVVSAVNGLTNVRFNNIIIVTKLLRFGYGVLLARVALPSTRMIAIAPILTRLNQIQTLHLETIKA